MSKIKMIIVGILLLLLQNGCKDPKPPKPPKPSTEISGQTNLNHVGIGLTKGEIERYPVSPRGSYYYGQVIIEPKLTMHALSGPEAQTFFSHVANLFQEKRKNFGLSVTPIIDGHRLPPIVLFTYSYDSEAQQWITTFNEEPRTAMTLIKANTELSFELSYTSIDRDTFNRIKEATRSIYGGDILLSAINLPVIDLIGDNVGHMMSHSIKSSTTLYFVPSATRKKSVKYIVKTKDGKQLAEVKFSLILRDSVVSGTVVDSNSINSTPKVSSDINPLTQVYTHINEDLTLNDRLNREESISTFSQIQDPRLFRENCINIQDRLSTYGLNILDSYSAFSKILERTNFLTDRRLYYSGCLTANKLARMQEMGINMPPPPDPQPIHVDIQDEMLGNFGRYMLNPKANVGFKSDLLKLFSDTVIVPKNDLMDFSGLYTEEDEAVMTPEAFMQHLGEIGVARYGSYSHQKKDFRYFLFRPLNSTSIYRIMFRRERGWGRIRTVIIQPWADENIAPIIQNRLRTPAENSVLGYENDVYRGEELD
jgi:hypothetical protein